MSILDYPCVFQSEDIHHKPIIRRPGVDCGVGEEKKECAHCGWNPAVKARRLAKLQKEMRDAR